MTKLMSTKAESMSARASGMRSARQNDLWQRLTIKLNEKRHTRSVPIDMLLDSVVERGITKAGTTSRVDLKPVKIGKFGNFDRLEKRARNRNRVCLFCAFEVVLQLEKARGTLRIDERLLLIL